MLGFIPSSFQALSHLIFMTLSEAEVLFPHMNKENWAEVAQVIAVVLEPAWLQSSRA